MCAAGRSPLGGPKALLLLAAAIGSLLGLTVSGARAQSGKGDYIGSWSVSAALGYAVPTTDEYGNVGAWRIGVGYTVLPQLEFGLELARFETGVSQPEADGTPSHDIASGRLEVRPVSLAAHYRTVLPEMLSTVTVSVGLGYYFIDYTMAETQRQLFLSGDVQGLPDQEVDDAWGVHLGAGLEYALTERLSLTAEGRYLFLSPSVRGTVGSGNRISGSLDLDTWLFTGGVKVAL